MKNVERRIVGFHRDEQKHWVAQLECGHTQQMRHNQPWQTRPWVATPQDRAHAMGQVLSCRKCGVTSEAHPRPKDVR